MLAQVQGFATNPERSSICTADEPINKEFNFVFSENTILSDEKYIFKNFNCGSEKQI